MASITVKDAWYRALSNWISVTAFSIIKWWKIVNQECFFSIFFLFSLSFIRHFERRRRRRRKTPEKRSWRTCAAAPPLTSSMKTSLPVVTDLRGGLNIQPTTKKCIYKKKTERKKYIYISSSVSLCVPTRSMTWRGVAINW